MDKIKIGERYSTEGLPDSLLKMLKPRREIKNPALDAFLKVLADYEGKATINEMLVGLYRETGKVYDEKTLSSFAYRLRKKGILTDNKGAKRGYYEILNNIGV